MEHERWGEKIRQETRQITLASDWIKTQSPAQAFFRNIFVTWTVNRSEAASSWLPVKQGSTFEFFEEVAEMFGLLENTNKTKIY